MSSRSSSSSEPELVEDEPPLAQAIADRRRDRFGLLVDLLQHERLEPGLLGALVVPVELDELVVGRAAVDGAEVGRPLGPDDDDLAVVGELHLPRLAQERGGVRGDEGLARRHADDHRALQPRSDEHAGVVAMDRDEGEVALELGVRASHGLDEVALVVLLDQVRDGLGVGLGREDVALLDEAGAELAVVLDDPVQDDRELLALLGGERVCVRLGDAAVRRPARVAEPGRRGRGVVTRVLPEVREVPDGPRVGQASRLRARRFRPSRSLGTRGARGRGGGEPCTHGVPRNR